MSGSVIAAKEWHKGQRLLWLIYTWQTYGDFEAAGSRTKHRSQPAVMIWRNRDIAPNAEWGQTVESESV